MFPKEIWFNPVWCLYDDINGCIVLKHPFRAGLVVLCPHCGKPLHFEHYQTACCGHTFATSFGEIRQKSRLAAIIEPLVGAGQVYVFTNRRSLNALRFFASSEHTRDGP